MRISNVGTLSSGESVDLIVHATSTYSASNAPLNRVNEGQFGVINVLAGTKVDLVFEFIDSSSGESVEIPQFDFTFYDFDQKQNGEQRELLYIEGYDTFAVTESTEVAIVISPDGGRTEFSSSTYGIGKDNPVNPEFSSLVGSGDDTPASPTNLTQQQRDRAVEFTFKATSSFALTLEVEGVGKGRNFLFAGQSFCLPTCFEPPSLPPPLPPPSPPPPSPPYPPSTPPPPLHPCIGSAALSLDFCFADLAYNK